MQPRAPESLMRRAARGYELGLLSLNELAQWHGTDPGLLREDLGEAGSRMPEHEDQNEDEDGPLFPDGPLAQPIL